MAQSASPDRAMERRTLADVCGRDASRPKADLQPQAGATRLRDVAAETIRAGGKQESAARDIEIHPARLSHKLKDGSLTLAQLEKLGPDYARAFGEGLMDQFGPVDTKAKLRRELRALREQTEVVADLVEKIAS